MLLIAVLGGVFLANLLHGFGVEAPGSAALVVSITVGAVAWRVQARSDREGGHAEPGCAEEHLHRAWRGLREMVRQTFSGLAGLALFGVVAMLLLVRTLTAA